MLQSVNESASSEDRAAEAVGQGSVVQIYYESLGSSDRTLYADAPNGAATVSSRAKFVCRLRQGAFWTLAHRERGVKMIVLLIIELIIGLILISVFVVVVGIVVGVVMLVIVFVVVAVIVIIVIVIVIVIVVVMVVIVVV